MTVPDYQTFMRPLLAYASDGQEHNIGQAIQALADDFKLDDQDRTQMLPSGKQTLLANRVHWARTYLAKAQALKRTRRSHFIITDRGRELLAKHPHRIDVATLKQFPEFIEFVVGGGNSEDKAQPKAAISSEPAGGQTPEEAIEAAQLAIESALKVQLLESLLELSPAFFEQVVVDLIVAMGYGGSRGSVAERLGKSGDEGIDGVVNEDPLGLDIVYLQAKRYSPGNSIGRPAIQQFAGALVGQGASKGVFITTSAFSSGAFEFVKQIPQRIVLIDGKKLTELMIQYGVGVRAERTIEVKKIDADYFEEADE